MDRTTDLARPRERAGVTHGNGPAVKHNRRLHVLAVMRRRKISKATSHAETSHADGTRLHIALRLQMSIRGPHVIYGRGVLEPVHDANGFL